MILEIPVNTEKITLRLPNKLNGIEQTVMMNSVKLDGEKIKGVCLVGEPLLLAKTVRA